MKPIFHFLTLVLLLALAGCTRTTPPGPNSAMGQWQEHQYLLLRWDNGRTLMFWHDAGENTLCEGSGSTDDPTYRMTCMVDRDSTSISWNLETTDGQTISLTFDDTETVISTDTLLLLEADNGRFSFTQSPHSFDNVQIEDQDTIIDYAENDPDISAFIDQ